MGDAYPELRRNRETIEKTILAEEHRFEAVLTDGLPRLEAELAKVLGTKSKSLPGAAAFQLYDTFGIPYDFIEDTAATQGVTVDKTAFDAAMDGQRDKARAGSAFGGKKGEEFAIGGEAVSAALTGVGDTFEGYSTTSVSGVPVLALFDEQRQPVEALSTNQSGYAALAQTPFYLESGGQVSDTGRIVNEATGASAKVEGLARIRTGLPRAHRVRVTSGELRVRDIVTAEVDAEVRNATRRNHTATHLLHAALREVLGTHVKQAGSLVSPDRLRFDFVHFQADHPRRARSHRADRQRADLPQHAGDDRGAVDPGGDRRRRDGAVRREIRRPGARRQRAGVQPRAVRRHARERDRRHRLLRHRGRGRRRGGHAANRGADRRRRGRVGAAPAGDAVVGRSRRCT